MPEPGALTEQQPSPAASAVPCAPPAPPPRAKPSAPGRRKSAAGLVVALVAAAAIVSIAAGVGRRALAESWIASGALDNLERATRWLPANQTGWTKSAALQSRAEGDPAAAVEAWERAVELRGRDVQARVELGLALEGAGNHSGAEQVLLEAAEVDPGFLPRWTLANYYLRVGLTDEYWTWTSRAVEADPRRLPAAMDLSWRAFGDADLILERGVPDEPSVNRAYFKYLIDRDRLGPMRAIWPRLEPDLVPGDVPDAAVYLDRLLLSDQVASAVEVWNSICRKRYVPYRPLSLGEGPYLTNGDFSGRITGLGFDWKVPAAEGVTRVQTQTNSGENGLEIRLSGAQPEYTQLILQIIPIRPARRYVLIYEYATQQLPSETGIGWVVRDSRTEQVIAEPASLENAEDFWYETSFSFDAPEDVGLIHLELKYERIPGTTRQRGRFVMRRLRLEPMGPAGAGG